ncbi:antibiotic ABC transporter permease [Finegoldia magna]|uniref:antibiotic ABC transporter permease n=1 Tax=Finegoldia magna TaxID=1260 RepID=UPI0029146F09|nr:antibiotic ABC transporter permease [Finegoldia magna]MDU7165873.1 antibiotic ABC transporter permease [Finegoldia magna]
MFSKLLLEFNRDFSEIKKYKFNVIFANIAVFLMALFIIDGLFVKEKEIVFLMMILWYYATYSIESPTFLIQNEITDRTLISIVQSKTGILSVVLYRNLVECLMNTIKVIVIFTLIFVSVDFDYSKFNHIPIIILVMVVSVFILYQLGTFLSSFTLLYKRLGSFVALAETYMLFFGDITVKVNNKVLLFINKIIFPFNNARTIFTQLQLNNVRYDLIVQLLIQAVVLSVLVKFSYDKNIQKSMKRGNLYGI